MLRPLLLAILGALLLCVFTGVPQHSLIADTSGGMHGDSPKQPQMDVPPTLPSLTASQLQTMSVLSQKAEAVVLTNNMPLGGKRHPAVVFVRDSIQASTLLRI
jgi:hypothetical protein